MSSFSEEAGVTLSFSETILDAEEGDLAIDREATERSVSLDSPFLPQFNVAEREGDECVRRALEQISGKISARVVPVCAVGADDESGGRLLMLLAMDEMTEQNLNGSHSQTPCFEEFCFHRLF